MNNLCAVQQCHKGFAIGTNVLQDYQRQHYESVLKVIDVIPAGIVLPVTDIKSNKFKEAINDRALRARAKNRNKKDLLAYHILYRLRGTLNSIYLLFLQAGIRFTRASFPGTWSPLPCACAGVGKGVRAGEHSSSPWDAAGAAVTFQHCRESLPGGMCGAGRLGHPVKCWAAALLPCANSWTHP